MLRNHITCALLSTLTAALSGCYNYHDIPIKVLDRATNRPIAGAQVAVFYRPFPLLRFYNLGIPPINSVATTDARGQATLLIGEEQMYVVAVARGYHDGREPAEGEFTSSIPEPLVLKLEPAHP